jgi:hypothetical protein
MKQIEDHKTPAVTLIEEVMRILSSHSIDPAD